MNKILLLIIFATGFYYVKAQSLSPFVVSASGGFYANSTAQLSFTTGEMTMVETFSKPGNILTQGFQQPDSNLSTSIINLPEAGLQIKVFPNPATDQLSVSIRADKDMSYRFSMTDIIGKNISAKVYDASTIETIYTMD